MPVNRRWNISELMDACRVYRDSTGRRISFEYTLIKEVKSARDLKYVKLSKAEVQFILFDEWVIAKLIKVRR